MKMTTSWAFASAAVVAILVAGCTTEVTDGSEGGVSTGSAGSAAGAAGAGTGGDMSTPDGGGTGGSSSDTDGGMTLPVSACGTCAATKCKTDNDACLADTAADGCAANMEAFYTCLKAADTADKVGSCGEALVSQVGPNGNSQSLASELGGCVGDTDPTKGCLAECMGMAAAGDAGAE